MTHLSDLELQNWIALYAAVGICCVIAIALSLTAAAVELYREQAWQQCRTIRGAALFLPRTWWRWQKLYLLSTPMTLLIVGYFAASLTWS